MSQIIYENGVLVVYTPYDPALVAAIKGLPYSERKWDPARKAWLVDPKHAQTMAGLFNSYLGIDIQLPRINVTGPQKEMRLLDCRYVGMTKTRDDGTRSAYGYVDNEWKAVFPESVLRNWFEAGPETPDQAPTLYAVLGISKSAGGDEVKSAFRRMARQWHPDVCREPDAAEQFRLINNAYEILSNPRSRGRYDAGLALEATIKHETYNLSYMVDGYRAPLRCGSIMAVGVEKLGRFWVEKIQLWEDIVLSGKTLVVSWPMGAKEPMEQWV